MTEWHYKPRDWSKEPYCVKCRFPPIDIVNRVLADRKFTCRECEHIEIKICKCCGEEMGYCDILKNPPSKRLDEKNKCVKFKRR